jgi:trimeric autotransporter adhesin
MMNIYNGTVTTDAEGNATVQMPGWFEALNRDFRYQLTSIGQAAQAYISSELNNRQFSIKTDKPNVKISWQVTGVRQDAWANAHRIPVEVEKSASERGLYMHPELFGAPADRSIAAHRHPGMMKPPAKLPQTTKPLGKLSLITPTQAAKH